MDPLLHYGCWRLGPQDIATAAAPNSVELSQGGAESDFIQIVYAELPLGLLGPVAGRQSR